MEDDGTIVGIGEGELGASLKVLKGMCDRVGATVRSIEQRRVSRRPELHAAEAHVVLERPRVEGARRMTKVAFVGESDGGKSTLLGVLTTAGEDGNEFSLDNGSGSVRMSMLRHRHELISGRTSSLAVEFLPFDEATQSPIRLGAGLEPLSLGKQRELLSTGRVVQLLDLPGEPKYQKVTLSVLTAWAAPDWIGLVVPSSAYDRASGTFSEATLDNLGLLLGLELPFFIVVSKLDMIESTSVQCSLSRDLLDLVVRLRKELLGADVPPYAVSLQQLSCVTGQGLCNFRTHLYRLRPRRSMQLMGFLLGALPDAQMLFCVEGVQLIPEAGVVLLGSVAYGCLDLQEGGGHVALLIPGEGKGDGQRPIQIRVLSAHRMRLPVTSVGTGEMVTLAVAPATADDPKLDPEQISKGSILAVYASSSESPPILPHANVVAADVVGRFPSEQIPSVGEPIQGSLYWLGTRWNARLTALSSFYGEIKLRAEFTLLDECRGILMPGTRLVFVCPQFRLTGFTHVPRHHG